MQKMIAPSANQLLFDALQQEKAQQASQLPTGPTAPTAPPAVKMAGAAPEITRQAYQPKPEDLQIPPDVRYTRERSALTFSPYAWAKLCFLRDLGPTEISGFGICDEPGNLTHVTDFVMVPQVCTSILTTMDDEGLAQFAYQMTKLGLQMLQYQRVWIHTHPPGMSPNPSGTDEGTFKSALGDCDWAIMFILAADNRTFCRLRYTTGPTLSQEIPVRIDYRGVFRGSDREAWQAEYLANVSWAHPPRQKHATKLWSQEEEDWWRNREVRDQPIERARDAQASLHDEQPIPRWRRDGYMADPHNVVAAALGEEGVHLDPAVLVQVENQILLYGDDQWNELVGALQEQAAGWLIECDDHTLITVEAALLQGLEPDEFAYSMIHPDDLDVRDENEADQYTLGDADCDLA